MIIAHARRALLCATAGASLLLVTAGPATLVPSAVATAGATTGVTSGVTGAVGTTGSTTAPLPASRPVARATTTTHAWTVAASRGQASTEVGSAYRAVVRLRGERRTHRVVVVLRHVVSGKVVSLRAAVVRTEHHARRARLPLQTSARRGAVQLLVRSGDGRVRTRLVGASITRVVGPGTAGPAAQAAANGASTTPLGARSYANWRLDMVDTFSGTTLNPARWSALDRFHMGGRADVSMARNVRVQDGNLRVAMTKEWSTGSDGSAQPYTSGTAWSRDGYQLPNYFRVEFRVKVPWQPGIWPGSVWFRPTDWSDGEIDAFELRGQDLPVAGQTVHSGGYGSSHVQDVRAFRVADPHAYHTVTVTKTRHLIAFYLDGRLTHTVTPKSPAWNEASFETPRKKWFIWMNLQAGGWGGLPTALTNFSGDQAAMFVDHVYVWKQQ